MRRHGLRCRAPRGVCGLRKPLQKLNEALVDARVLDVVTVRARTRWRSRCALPPVPVVMTVRVVVSRLRAE
jgi:hypothetical protein